MKHIHLLYTFLFGVAALIFFGLAYPHHLHYQEQYQLFLFDSSYAWDVVKLPGGVADLLGRFCTQFFLFAWVGALIIAVLLSAVQLQTLRLISHSWMPSSRALSTSKGGVGAYYGLSFVPAFLLWLFLLDENALMGGVWAVLLTLHAAWGLVLVHHRWVRRAALVIAVPVLYWVAGPLCVVFFLLSAAGAAGSSGAAGTARTTGTAGVTKTSGTFGSVAWSLGALGLLVLMIVMLSSLLPVPTERLWLGVHYHRYPTVVPVLLWAAALSVFVITLIARFFQSEKQKVKRMIHFSLFALTVIIMGYFIWTKANFKAEKVMQYDFMARHQQWNRILETINAEKPNNQIGVTVQNLALAMHGMLADHLFDYNQNGIAGLLPDVQSDATSPLPTAEAFYQLGLVYVAQRTVFEAQESILDFQKSARCYKRLAETNLINGNYEVARKYLMALQKTLFYKKWADETLLLLGNEETIAKHPEYGRLRQWACDEDFYFGDRVTSEMLESLFFSNTDNRLAFEYLKAYYLLTGDREGFAKLLQELRVRNQEMSPLAGMNDH